MSVFAAYAAARNGGPDAHLHRDLEEVRLLAARFGRVLGPNRDWLGQVPSGRQWPS